MSTNDQAIEDRIRELLDEAGIDVAVSVENRVARLIGPVDSIRLHEAALDLAGSVDGVRDIEDEISYEVISPDMVTEPNDDDEQFGYADRQSLQDDISDEDGDFSGSPGTVNQIEVIEDGATYFPPVDPVVEPVRGPRELEVVGGFQEEATDDTEEESAEAFDESVPLGEGTRLIQRDDDDILDDVNRELREDSETTTLKLHVSVRRGVVTIRGEVQSIDDAENAESVASRVPGVVEVVDRTEIR